MRYFFIAVALLLILFVISVITMNDTEVLVNLLAQKEPKKMSLGFALVISFVLGFMICFLVLFLPTNTKLKKLTKENQGLKGKVGKITKDLAFQMEKMSIFEDTMKSKPPPPPPPPPPKKVVKTFLGIPIKKA